MKVYLFPGQGSQSKGMGAELFDEFPELCAKADAILGRSIRELCLNDPGGCLARTEYTQPALFVVNALTYLKKVRNGAPLPDFVAGHSLGEYNALCAAGVFDFEAGLRLVQRRGELMSRAPKGGMAAVVNCEVPQIRELLKSAGIDAIDVANFNSPKQTVLSGPVADLEKAQPVFERANAMFIPLNVSAPFHSRYMRSVVSEFAKFLTGFEFQTPRFPVVANVDARPYTRERIALGLTEQLCSSVQWTDTIRFLMGKGQFEFEELGPGNVLTKLVRAILSQATPITDEEAALPPLLGLTPLTKGSTAEAGQHSAAEVPRSNAAEVARRNGNGSKVAVVRDARPVSEMPPSVSPKNGTAVSQVSELGHYSATRLGSREFIRHYGLRYAYLGGAMYNGIASRELVVRLARAGCMGFLGTGGMKLRQVEEDIGFIQRQADGAAYGMNLLHRPDAPMKELEMVDLFLSRGVRVVEASAYIQMTPALVKYRLKGLVQGAHGAVEARHSIIGKISRPEVARAFLSPAPEAIVKRLLQEGQVTAEQAELAKRMPMADDLCAEADSGGHTDGAIPTVLLPSMLRLRDNVCRQFGYARAVRVGAAGGIGTPEAVAAAFVLGADFVLTGSINQCTPEAGTSDRVKDMLQQLDIQDTDYAPAGDMFEIGAKVQVMKRGVFFAARANKLYSLWNHHSTWEEIDPATRAQIEERYWGRSFSSIYDEMKAHYGKSRPEEIAEAERNGKRKMALVFRWYFVDSSRAAIAGDERRKVDYQVHTGPAMGAFNQWVKGTELEDWRCRHVDEIGLRLLDEAALLLNAKCPPIRSRSVGNIELGARAEG